YTIPPSYLLLFTLSLHDALPISRDERLQNKIAQLRILIQYLPKFCLRHFINLTIGSRDRTHDLRTASQMANVAREISGALHPDRLRLIAGDIDNFKFTRLDDKEPGITITGAKQRLSRVKRFR